VPARRLRALEKASRRDAAPYNALFEAAVWFDLGEYRHAAALFDSISRAPRDSTPSQIARHLAWTQSLRATALAALGDTLPLPAIADSVERWGQQSSYGRDRRLHHHVRGLLLEARGRLPEAATELERGIFSPVIGYTRTNVELGRLLLRLDRPREAASWAEAALHGPFDGPNSYVTQTELAELAAVAWDAAGVRDSAARRFRQVIQNWTNAESTFGARIERARLRLAMLERR
jgi:tetratricopeptide (TPR) repeat protein